MRLLVDTHTLFWSVGDPSKISAPAMAAMVDPTNVRVLSAATIWELAIKIGQGKITLSMPYGRWMETAITDYASALSHLNSRVRIISRNALASGSNRGLTPCG